MKRLRTSCCLGSRSFKKGLTPMRSNLLVLHHLIVFPHANTPLPLAAIQTPQVSVDVIDPSDDLHDLSVVEAVTSDSTASPRLSAEADSLAVSIVKDASSPPLDKSLCFDSAFPLSADITTSDAPASEAALASYLASLEESGILGVAITTTRPHDLSVKAKPLYFRSSGRPSRLLWDTSHLLDLTWAAHSPSGGTAFPPKPTRSGIPS